MAAVNVCWYRLGPGLIHTKSIPIGKPLDNDRCFILDTQHQPLPIEVVGEMVLAGPKISRGYMGSPMLTNKTFVPPESISTGRLYCTGDRARWLQSGHLEFVGRIDFQVKLNGQRIETGEIEAVIRESSAVSNAVVMVNPQLKQLVAYVLSSKGVEIEQTVLEVCTPAQLIAQFGALLSCGLVGVR